LSALIAPAYHPNVQGLGCADCLQLTGGSGRCDQLPDMTAQSNQPMLLAG
jgi:hypothetical protein